MTELLTESLSHLMDEPLILLDIAPSRQFFWPIQDRRLDPTNHPYLTLTTTGARQWDLQVLVLLRCVKTTLTFRHYWV